jgi:hypothetical protein
MPYKDPERKRQWEREHREQRNERRRTSHPAVSSELSSVEMPMPDPGSDQGSQGIWILLGLAVATGVVLLAVFAGVSGFNVRHFGTRGAGNLPKNPG